MPDPAYVQAALEVLLAPYSFSAGLLGVIQDVFVNPIAKHSGRDRGSAYALIFSIKRLQKLLSGHGRPLAFENL
jgi:hypothetical protein